MDLVKMQRNRTKRGFAQIAPMVLMLGAAIILLTIFVKINAEVTTAMRGDVSNVDNESVSGINNLTYIALAHPDVSGISGLAVNSTLFSDAYDIILSPNYTLDASTGRVKLIYDGEYSFDGNDSRVNYTFYQHGAPYNVSSAGTTALENISDYWGLLVTIGIFVIILGLIAGAFVSRGRR